MLRAVLGTAVLMLASCSSAVYVQANVQGYGLASASSGNFQAFVASVAPDSPNPLRDEAIGRLVAAELTARGLENHGLGAASAQDELGFVARLTISESSVEVPQQIHVTESYRAGYSWRYRTAGSGQWITVHSPGEWYPRTWISGGYVVQEFTHFLVLQFSDAAGREIWRGELTAHGRSADLMAVMRACIPELLAEFPSPSGRPSERRIRIDRPPE